MHFEKYYLILLSFANVENEMDLTSLVGRLRNDPWSCSPHGLLHWCYQCPRHGTAYNSDYFQHFLYSILSLSLQLMKVWCNQTVQEKYGSTLSTSGLDILWSSIVSIFLVGGAIGSMGGAGLANKFGRFVFYRLKAMNGIFVFINFGLSVRTKST